MGGQDAVGGLPAHGKAGPVQVAHADLEHAVCGAVADGQVHVNGGDLDMAHDARAGHIQQGLVGLPGLVAEGHLLAADRQAVVVVLGGLEQVVIFRLIQVGHGLGVAGDGLGGAGGVPPVADGGVQEQGQACKKDQYKQDGRGIGFLLHCRTLLAAGTGSAPAGVG